jgi:hypothetical protein
MNVIPVMSDSFRGDHIGALGNKGARTPALDRSRALCYRCLTTWEVRHEEHHSHHQ